MSDEIQHVPKGMIPRNEVFTKEALKAQDGKVVPLTLENGGPVIGEATLHYDEGRGDLIADFTVDDPVVAGFLNESLPDILGRKKFIGEAD
jgi:hypothetical protein